MFDLFRLWMGFRRVHPYHRYGTKGNFFSLRKLDKGLHLFNGGKVDGAIKAIPLLLDMQRALGDEFTSYFITEVGKSPNYDIIIRELTALNNKLPVLNEIAEMDDDVAISRKIIIFVKELNLYMPDEMYLWYSRARFAVRKQRHKQDKGRQETSPWEASL